MLGDAEHPSVMQCLHWAWAGPEAAAVSWVVRLGRPEQGSASLSLSVVCEVADMRSQSTLSLSDVNTAPQARQRVRITSLRLQRATFPQLFST